MIDIIKEFDIENDEVILTKDEVWDKYTKFKGQQLKNKSDEAFDKLRDFNLTINRKEEIWN